VFDDVWVGSDVGTGALARKLRERGTAVVGGTLDTDRLETDRGHAMETFDDARTDDEGSRDAAVVCRTERREGIHLEDTKEVDGRWRVAGGSGVALVVTDTGATVRGARRQASERVDGVIVPNCYYRDDVGERWVDGDGDRLQAWGYFGP
jgi:phosphoribosylamine-glycine ligase